MLGAPISLTIAPAHEKPLPPFNRGRNFCLALDLHPSSVEKIRKAVELHTAASLDDYRLHRLLVGTPKESQPTCTMSLFYFEVGRALWIFVRTPEGRTVSLQINSSDAVDTLKAKVFQATGTSPDMHRMIFAGKALASGE
jgi:hypothetical protein